MKALGLALLAALLASIVIRYEPRLPRTPVPKAGPCGKVTWLEALRNGGGA